MKNLQTHFLPLVLMVSLAACGGGGGGGSSPTTPTTTGPTAPGPTTTNTPNRAPTLSGSPPATHAATEDTAFSYAFGRHFTDPDNNNLTYALAGNPAWLRINGANLVGTPTNAHVTSAPVRVMLTASDGSLTVTYNFTITVANVNDPPARANAIANPPTVMAGRGFSYIVPANTFSDADASDSLTYTASLVDGSALPSGLTFNAATRSFTGTPAAGNYSIRVTARDRAGATATADFMLTVADMLPSEDGVIGLVQAVPASNVMVNPHHGLVTFSHIGFGDASLVLRGNCPGNSGTSVRKTLRDIAGASDGGMQLDPTNMYNPNPHLEINHDET